MIAAPRPGMGRMRERVITRRSVRAVPAVPAPRPLHQLPAQPTPLIGRELDLYAARAYLLERGARLLSLTGPAGIGKTRLALALAESLLDEHPDGVVFADLAPIHDPALVAPALARALGLGQAAAETP